MFLRSHSEEILQVITKNDIMITLAKDLSIKIWEI